MRGIDVDPAGVAESRQLPTNLNEVQLSERSLLHGFHLRLRPLIVGVVHGLTGSAAVALLVLPMIWEPYWATFYLLIFGVGTIAEMMLMTAIIGKSLPTF